MADNKTVEDDVLPVADFGAILGKTTETTKWVDVPQWNSRVKIKSLTKADQIKLRKSSQVRGQVDDVKLEMNLLIYGLVEPRLTWDQVEELFVKSDASALNRITAAILTLSGLTEDYIGQAESDLKS